MLSNSVIYDRDLCEFRIFKIEKMTILWYNVLTVNNEGGYRS